MKHVQISYEAFCALLRYFFTEPTEEDRKTITDALNGKLEAMIKHELYTQSKTALTDTEREKARQEYLDRIGVPENFRW